MPWPFSPPADCRQTRHDIVRRVWDTVVLLPWQRTAPRPDLVETTGTGAAFCLADPGRTYLVYLETRSVVSVRMARATGHPYRVEWINAQDSSDRRIRRTR